MENSKRTRCEIFSRIVGYIRPITQWNDGKLAEFKMRTLFVPPAIYEEPVLEFDNNGRKNK